MNKHTGPAPSNGLDFDHVQYPEQSTISAVRSQAQQQDLTNQGFNQVYQQLFSDLMNAENPQTAVSLDLLDLLEC